MKFNKLASININKSNNQISFNLKRKELKKLGMTVEELMDMTILKPKAKFYKK